jgi:hypothetical protein
MALQLSWCSLVRIILSQVGGSPLQQVYSQLNQGLPAIMPKSGLLPAGLSDIKNMVDTFTNTIHAAQAAANDFSDTINRVAGQFYQNPMGTASQGTIDAIDARTAVLDGYLAQENLPEIDRTRYTSEKAALASTRASVVKFKSNTDRLSGVSAPNASTDSECSLQDLLGNGCTRNGDVPDVNIKNLVDSLKQGDLIDAIKNKITNATGLDDLTVAVNEFKNSIEVFNTSFTTQLNKAALTQAISGQLTQIVFNLLSGCGNEVLDLTVKKSVKDTIAPYVALMEQQNIGKGILSDAGTITKPTDTAVTPAVMPRPEIIISTTNASIL